MVKEYSQRELDKGASELDALGFPNELSEMMGDYANLRNQARACVRP